MSPVRRETASTRQPSVNVLFCDGSLTMVRKENACPSQAGLCTSRKMMKMICRYEMRILNIAFSSTCCWISTCCVSRTDSLLRNSVMIVFAMRWINWLTLTIFSNW